MKKSKIKAIIVRINNLAKMGVLSSNEYTDLQGSVSELLHAVATKNYKRLEKAVNKIAKLLLNV